MTKDEWRNKGKQRRKTLSNAERISQETILTHHLIHDPRWQRAKTVLLYLSFGSEWSTAALIQAAWANNKIVALTHCEADHRMSVCRYTKDTPLVTTIGNLREIAPNALEPLPLESIDFCLVPGLLFDPYGTRLGYGAGYYDRFLSTLPSHCTILACGFDCQLVGAPLPSEPTDYRLPEIWTPSTHILTRQPFHQ